MKKLTRDKVMRFRVTSEQFKIIKEKAKILGVSVSEYLRLIALGKKIKIKEIHKSCN